MLKILIDAIKWITLVVLIVPSFLFLADRLTLDQAKWIMLVATFGWFVMAPLSSWYGERSTGG